jgi:hypothetical protein
MALDRDRWLGIEQGINNLPPMRPRPPLARVQVHARRNPNQYTVMLYTDDPRIPPHTFALGFETSESMLPYILAQYVEGIVRNGFATRDLIDVPELDPKKKKQEELEHARLAMEHLLQLEKARERERARRMTPNPLEVNMVEALTGWKTWKLQEKSNLLVSPLNDMLWCPDRAAEARCVEKCADVPHEEHTCGIYASDEPTGARGGPIRGRVYGWGRYIRGESGWRAQFAYPQSFYLLNCQAHLVEQLRSYHVPIFVDTPTLLYNPQEDGYEHREDQTDGDRGTAEDAATS